MTDQPFQPATTDPTQVTAPSQGGVFGGFVGVEEAPTPKIPDASELFGTSADTEIAVTEPAVVENPMPEISSFEDLNLSKEVVIPQAPAPVEEPVTPVEESISPFQEETAPVVDEPIVEESIPVVEEPIVEEAIVAPVEQEQAPLQEPVVEEVVATVEETPDFNTAPIVDEPVQTVAESVSTETVPVSDVKAKYNELANNIRSIIGNNTEDGYVDIVGSNTDTSHVEYRFTEEEDIVEVTRTESNKQTGEENSNTIAFVSELDEGLIQVYLDDTLLFEEQELVEDPKKKMQVMEKFNKFIFLTGEKLKDIEKARKAQEAELQEKRRLQDIFRNF